MPMLPRHLNSPTVSAVRAMRVALDTNILAYAEGVNGLERKRTLLRTEGVLGDD